jgi:hypothetical protein
MMGDKKYGVYEGDYDYWCMRVARDVSMDTKGVNIGEYRGTR